MLCQFSLQNYKCFRDLATFDLQAGKIDEHNDFLIRRPANEKYLPLAVVYGPNSTGKSKLYEALHLLSLILSRQDTPEKKPPALNKKPKPAAEKRLSEKFIFEQNSLQAYSEFEIYFQVARREFRYLLTLDEGAIVFERLEFRELKPPSALEPIFEREGQSFCLFEPLNGLEITAEISETRAFASSLREFGAENQLLGDFFNFFDQKFLFFDLQDRQIHESKALILKYKRELLQFLKDLEPGLKDFEFKAADLYLKYFVAGRESELPLSSAAEGVKGLFHFWPLVLESLKRGAFLFADKLDAFLDTRVLEYLISLYNNPSANRNGAQLAFTTHNALLLRRDLLRRDQIYFTLKGGDAAAKLYSFSDFIADSRPIQEFYRDFLAAEFSPAGKIKVQIDWKKFYAAR